MIIKRAVLTLAAAMVSLAIAIVAGVVSVATGKTPLEALMPAAGAFACSMTLCLVVITFLSPPA